MTKQIFEEDVQKYIETLKLEFPKLVITKRKPWWLRVLTSLPGFHHLDRYTQTIGNSIFLSSRWDLLYPAAKISVLRHERKHLLQFRKYGFLGMSFLYLLVFFPIYFSWFRARFEREGYAENCRSRVEYYGATEDQELIMRSVYLDAFTSWSYLKTWPYKSKILQWFREDWDIAVREFEE